MFMCPFKPGLPPTIECAKLLGETCPMYEECLAALERSDKQEKLQDADVE